MVKSRNNVMGCLLIVLLILPFLLSLFSTQSKYTHSQFVFDSSAFFINVIAILVASILVLSILALCRSSVAAKILVLIPVCAIVIWGLLIVSGFTVNNFWKSQTTDFDNFTVDPYLNKEVTIAGLTIGDIVDSDIENVEGFEYSYNSKLSWSTFKFKGKFVFSEEKYSELKNAFVESKEFNKMIYDDLQTPIGFVATGYFEFDDTISMQETKTSVDEWDTLIILFNDDQFSFYFDLQGGYNT